MNFRIYEVKLCEGFVGSSHVAPNSSLPVRSSPASNCSSRSSLSILGAFVKDMPCHIPVFELCIIQSFGRLFQNPERERKTKSIYLAREKIVPSSLSRQSVLAFGFITKSITWILYAATLTAQNETRKHVFIICAHKYVYRRKKLRNVRGRIFYSRAPGRDSFDNTLSGI